MQPKLKWQKHKGGIWTVSKFPFFTLVLKQCNRNSHSIISTTIMKKLLLITLLLTLFNVTFGQTSITALHKAHKVANYYNPATQVYTKLYYTEAGIVKVVMDSVSKHSYELHKNSHTIPTNLRGLISVYYRNKTKRFSHTQMLRATKQL